MMPALAVPDMLPFPTPSVSWLPPLSLSVAVAVGAALVVELVDVPVALAVLLVDDRVVELVISAPLSLRNCPFDTVRGVFESAQ